LVTTPTMARILLKAKKGSKNVPSVIFVKHQMITNVSKVSSTFDLAT